MKKNDIVIILKVISYTIVKSPVLSFSVGNMSNLLSVAPLTTA